MAELPNGWVRARLSDVTTPTSSINPSALERSTFRYVDIGSIDNKTNEVVEPKVMATKEAPSRARRQIQNGDVLFSTVRTYLKNIAMVDSTLDGEITSTGIAVVRSNGAFVPHYMFNLLRSPDFIREISEQQDGTLYPAITDRDLFSTSIPLPPLAEQQRIVAKLGRLLARITSARKELTCLIKLVDRAKAGVLRAAFIGHDRWVSLDEILEGIKGGKNLRCFERPPEPHEKGVVKVSAVTWGEFDPKQSKTFPAAHTPPEDILIRPGDLLFSRANTVDFVGAVVIVDKAPGNLYLSDKVLRLDIAASWKEWVFWYLRSPEGREALMEASSGNQMSMRNISQSLLRRIQIPSHPIALRERKLHTIRTAMKKLSTVLENAESAVAKLDDLEQQIFAKAFRGDLVPQDPNDEPASALLARAKATPDKQKPEPRIERLVPVASPLERSLRKARTTAMPKARTDDDVWHKPYLARLLRLEILIDEIDLSVEFRIRDASPRTPEEVAQALFKKADLEIADFYRQLAWEIETGHIVQFGGKLRAA